VDASSWPTFHCGKKVRRPSMFKLMQHHTNNWEVGKLFSPSIGLPYVDVQPPRYAQIYNTLSNHKCFYVTIGNYPCCCCIYFVIMSTFFLGGRETWVQCKHLHHILQNIVYRGQSKEFIHFPMWSWDKIQRLLTCAKPFESQWYYNKGRFMPGFGVPISFSLFIVQYANASGKLPTMM